MKAAILTEIDAPLKIKNIELTDLKTGQVLVKIIKSGLCGAQIQEIKDELAKVLGKTIRIEAEVDPSLLGGLIVKAGSRMVDGSLKTKLNSLKQAMSEAG